MANRTEEPGMASAEKDGTRERWRTGFLNGAWPRAVEKKGVRGGERGKEATLWVFGKSPTDLGDREQGRTDEVKTNRKDVNRRTKRN